MLAELSIFNHRILRVLRLVSRGHQKFTKIYLKRYTYRVFSIFYHYGVFIFQNGQTCISEDIVELSNSMENLVVSSAEGNNTENGEF